MFTGKKKGRWALTQLRAQNIAHGTFAHNNRTRHFVRRRTAAVGHNTQQQNRKIDIVLVS